MDLGMRKQQIVSAIVAAYIRTGEPIGSKALVEALEQAVSSATIRNDMAELAAAGFLEQPHTSAGRIPTAKAFRLYIDRLMSCSPLSEEKKQEVDEALASVAGDPDRLMAEASQLLAQSTGVAAVAATPNQREACIRRVEVLATGLRTAAVLLMTDSGGVRSRVCRLSMECNSDALSRIAETLNREFGKCALSAVGVAKVQAVLVRLGNEALVYAPIITAFMDLVNDMAQAEVRLSGEWNLLQHPDYPLDRARSLLGFLSQRELLGGMLAAYPEGVRVVLGSESRRPELAGSCIIMTRYSFGQILGGSLGLIGRVRMAYALAIPRLQYVAQSVSRLLTRLIEE
ncbi:MAG: heat-inducible transcription repressor HrcA [Clostridia bacterium]|nr:heat-inducible transcription repressor HrcA [Clostridia bacterium]